MEDERQFLCKKKNRAVNKIICSIVKNECIVTRTKRKKSYLKRLAYKIHRFCYVKERFALHLRLRVVTVFPFACLLPRQVYTFVVLN